MADHTSTHFRQYSAGTERWRATPIKPRKSKIDYSGLEKIHPDAALNQKYLNAGAADDHERPLCFGVHQGVICKSPVTWKEGARYCGRGPGDE